MNFPLASRHGAAPIAGKELATSPKAERAMINLRMFCAPVSAQPFGHTAVMRASATVMGGMAVAAIFALGGCAARITVRTRRG
jgi:hypothetical protein